MGIQHFWWKFIVHTVGIRSCRIGKWSWISINPEHFLKSSLWRHEQELIFHDLSLIPSQKEDTTPFNSFLFSILATLALASILLPYPGASICSQSLFWLAGTYAALTSVVLDMIKMGSVNLLFCTDLTWNDLSRRRRYGIFQLKRLDKKKSQKRWIHCSPQDKNKSENWNAWWNRKLAMQSKNIEDQIWKRTDIDRYKGEICQKQNGSELLQLSLEW